MFEGLPKAWRELLEMTPQSNELESIDESLHIKHKPKQNNQIVYNLIPNPSEANPEGSFIL